MLYRVIEAFADLQDGKHLYKPGDAYPREGSKSKPERVKELSCGNNLLHRPLIKQVVEEPAEEHENREAQPVKRGRKRKTDE